MGPNPVIRQQYYDVNTGLVTAQYAGRAHYVCKLTNAKYITDIVAVEMSLETIETIPQGKKIALAKAYGAIFFEILYKLANSGFTELIYTTGIPIYPDSFDNYSRIKYEFLVNACQLTPVLDDEGYECIMITDTAVKTLLGDL